MLELRLLDPNGYTVPRTATVVPDDQAPTVARRLLTETAVVDAAHWAAFGYDARDYRVQTLPV